MAKRRQTYNLDRQTQLLDIHKQFMGGLKTIDTDDALSSVFLRDVNNLSLSEYGFLEKRYGTYINDEFQNIPFDGTKPIQGYFEYVDDTGAVHKILFYDGKVYIKNPKDENPELREFFIQRTGFITEPGLTYPDTTEIENETGWQSGQFDPEVPLIPPLPPEFFEGILKARSKTTASIGFGLLETETIDLLNAKTFAKSLIGFGVLETFEINLLEASLNKAISKINFYQPGTENINLVKTLDVASSFIDFDFEDGAPRVQLFTKTNVHKALIDFDFQNGPVNIGLTTRNKHKALIDFDFILPPVNFMLNARSLLAKSSIAFTDIQAAPPPIITATYNSNGGNPDYGSITGAAPLFVANPGSVTRTGFTFVNWSPTLPTTINNSTTFTAQFRLPAPIVNSGTISTTTNSISMVITNNNNNNIGNVTTQISVNGGAWSNIATFSDFRNNISHTVSGLAAGTSYTFAIRNTTSTANFVTSNTSTYGATTQAPPPPPPPPPKTATPSTTAVSSTSNSVTFGITNMDTSTATITWQIQGPFGTAASGSQSVSAQNGFQAIATGLSPSTTYSLISVVATAAGKDPSDTAPTRNLTTQAAPTCPAAGTVLNTFCDGFDLYEERADGSCGSTNVLIESNSATCGFVESDPVYTVRARLNTSGSTSGVGIQWETNSQSGQTNLNSTSFTTLTTQASSSVFIQVPTSFVFSSTTYILQQVTTTSGSVQSFGDSDYEIFNITANADITLAYGTQSSGGGGGGGGAGGGGGTGPEGLF